MKCKNWPVLYAKTATGSINFWMIWTEGPTVYMKWGQMGTENPLHDSYAAVGKNIGRSNETSPEDQAELEAAAKWVKQKRLKYVDSIEEARGGVNIKPMRCYSYDSKRGAKLKFPVTVQPKYNGCRNMAYPLDGAKVRFMSRGGKDYVLPHIQNELEGLLTTSWCLDGELYIHGMSLQKIRRLILTPSEESLRIQFIVYDMTQLPTNDLTWTARERNLYSWFANHHAPHVVMAESRVANSIEDIEAAHDYYVARGYEGCIIRSPHGKYKLAAKSTEILKYKKFMDKEFQIVGWTVGRDGILVYKCVQEEGIEFEVRPIGDEAERAELLKTADADVGKMLMVKYQERSEDNVPLIVSGITIRTEEDMD